MLEIDDIALYALIRKRQNEIEKIRTITLDELFAKDKEDVQHNETTF